MSDIVLFFSNQIVYYIKKGAHTLMLEKIVAGHDIGPYCTTVIYRTRIELLCSPTLLEYFAPKGQEDRYIELVLHQIAF